MHEAPVTLIAGTRKGIGKFLVEYYVARGHQVVGCSRSDIDWELPGYRHFVADVTDEATAKTIFSHLRRDYGRLDNLINNAGIASMNHTMLTPLSTVEQILDTNVVGSFLFAREAAKLMSTRKYGRIVNFTTVATPLKLEGEAIYAASKAAVKSLTEVMARELAAFGITVNAVGPTPIETESNEWISTARRHRWAARAGNSIGHGI
ncbi:SDR family NAD(P)-dependent oxidoreductase [Pseudomonas putida]|uniref:SDR family NAD(P)-dependent oxidoreductase n=1 Tax=Pseudomonas putida TaxID=303 RepID=UPI00383B8675